MKKHIKLALIFIVVLFSIISLTTQYNGGGDSSDHITASRYFTGNYKAKIRTSHTITYGIIHSPFVKIFQNLLAFKITSILVLFLIVFSVYYITKKDKRTFLLLIVSPIIWYMGPAIGPLQLSGLLFLWGFFFFSKFDKSNKISHLVYSGIFIGLAWSFWHTVLVFFCIFIVCFFYNRNINHLIIFIFSTIAGLIPLLLLDQILYGFALITTTKFFFMMIVMLIYGSIYQGINTLSFPFVDYLSLIIMVPFFSYALFSKKFFKENKRPIIFLILSFLFLLTNPSIRYLIFLWPILMLYLPKVLNKKQFKIQFIIFAIISLLIINSYAIQIKYSTNAKDLSSMIENFPNWEISSTNPAELIKEDLNSITKEYPNKIFVVGNKQGDYAYLARIYFGDKIKEFVSMEDYNLYLKDNPVLFEKEFKPIPRIKDRRQIWLAFGIKKNENDDTDYENINLGIGIEEPIKIDGFELINKYNLLYLSEKVNK